MPSAYCAQLMCDLLAIAKFLFDVLKGELEKKKFGANQVYNIDESGITTVQTPGKIIARRGAKQVGRVGSAEKGSTTTVVCGMNEAGVYVPPMFLYKRKNMNNVLMKHCPQVLLVYRHQVVGWTAVSLSLI